MGFLLNRGDGSDTECAVQLAIHPNLCSLPFSPKGTCDVTCNRCTPCPAPGGPQYCQANVEVQDLSFREFP